MQKNGILTVDDNEDGSRLDRVLIRSLGGSRRSLILRLIRKGNVRVNRKRVRPERRVQTGDEIFLPLSLRQTDEQAGFVPPLPDISDVPILFEDEYLLVVNKPVGMVVHGGSGHAGGLIESLKAQRNLPDLRLAHRIDRDTSGCLLMAKRLPVLRRLTESFRLRTAHKTYLAWVRGHPYPAAGRLHSYLSKGAVLSGERMVVDGEDGKEAITHYQTALMAADGGWPYALLALQPESGRTHQLRVQLQNEGHAILGDAKYARREDVRRFRVMGGRGMALHAWRLRIVHPMSGRELDVRAAWPERWQLPFAGLRDQLCAEPKW
jgi:23S rRNA pseudouridine955/2504/2580 synthase